MNFEGRQPRNGITAEEVDCGMVDGVGLGLIIKNTKVAKDKIPSE
jgi:hypothetical protein